MKLLAVTDLGEWAGWINRNYFVSHLMASMRG